MEEYVTRIYLENGY